LFLMQYTKRSEKDRYTGNIFDAEFFEVGKSDETTRSRRMEQRRFYPHCHCFARRLSLSVGREFNDNYNYSLATGEVGPKDSFVRRTPLEEVG
jgi:hypothetical protein